MNCSWRDCPDEAYDVEVWRRSSSGLLIVVGTCKLHDAIPPRPAGWEVRGGGGDPDLAREMFHGKYR